MHLDGGDLEAGQPLDLVGDARPDRGGDLGEVQPVLDDDVEVEPEPVAVAETPIPCVSLSRVSSRLSPLPAMPTTP